MEKLEEEYSELVRGEREEWLENEKRADESRRSAESLRMYRAEYGQTMSKEDRLESLALEEAHRKEEGEMRFRAEMHKRNFLEAVRKYQDFCRQCILNCEIQRSRDVREIPITGKS